MELTPEKLRELKSNRMGDVAIATMYGVKPYMVRRMRVLHAIDDYYDVMNASVNVEELKKMKRKGISDKQCAEHFGVSRSVIKRIRAQNKIIAPKASNREGIKSEAAQKRRERFMPQIVQLYSDGKTTPQISKAIGIPESTIRTWLRPVRNGETLPIYKGRTQQREDDANIVYNWIVAYKYQHNGNSPTRDEIASGAGFSSGHVYETLKYLAEQGRIILPETNRAGGIAIPGAQWIPPTGWKMPARLRTRRKLARPRRKERRHLEKIGRLCDCGRKATHFANVFVGTPTGKGGRPDRLPLCDGCAAEARKMGETVQEFPPMEIAA